MENIESNYKTEIEKNGVIAFVPRGNSMWPTLKNRGQSVIVKKKEGRLKEYDVAFYQRSNGAFVLHRVMEVKENGYVMLGDSQYNREDVLEEQVFGVLEGFYRGKKYVTVDNPRYLKKVKKWFKHAFIRKVRLKLFYKSNSIKYRLKKLFSRREK